LTRSLFVLAALAAWLTTLCWSPTESAATGAAPAPQEKDQDLIQGSWQAVKREVGDKVSNGLFREPTWVFKGDQITMLKSDDTQWGKFTFVLDPDKKPKTLKITRCDGDNKGKVIFAIYRIEGDSLVMTQSLDDFRKEFGGPGKKTGLMTFKRVKS
jgi:uncharacterized protein (TIGR03067 family)